MTGDDDAGCGRLDTECRDQRGSIRRQMRPSTSSKTSMLSAARALPVIACPLHRSRIFGAHPHLGSAIIGEIMVQEFMSELLMGSIILLPNTVQTALTAMVTFALAKRNRWSRRRALTILLVAWMVTAAPTYHVLTGRWMGRYGWTTAGLVHECGMVAGINRAVEVERHPRNEWGTLSWDNDHGDIYTCSDNPVRR